MLQASFGAKQPPLCLVCRLVGLFLSCLLAFALLWRFVASSSTCSRSRNRPVH